MRASEEGACTVQCKAEARFTQWLAESGGSLALTTYQAGKLLFIGWNGQQLSLHARNFDKAMGLDIRGDTLAMVTRAHARCFENASELASTYPREAPKPYDALYLERATYHTGDIFAHDLALTAKGLWIVNTRFSCLATLDHAHSFTPRWRPRFVTEIAPEDRCHLNGLALRDDVPQTVTALGVSDQPGGWRPQKATGGLVIDVPSGETIVHGLAMPHSPRWHEGHLWVLNSGTGELLQVDAAAGRTQTVCALPGYLRGMALVGDTAAIGLCKIREKRTFGGLPIEDQPEPLRCGVALVDLHRGRMKGFFEFTAGVEEIFDIRFLPGIRQPNLVSPDHPFSSEAFTTPEVTFWIRRQDEPEEESPPQG